MIYGLLFVMVHLQLCLEMKQTDICLLYNIYNLVIYIDFLVTNISIIHWLNTLFKKFFKALVFKMSSEKYYLHYFDMYEYWKKVAFVPLTCSLLKTSKINI